MQLIKRTLKFIFKVWAATAIGTIVFFVMTIGSLVALGGMIAAVSDSDIDEKELVYGEDFAEHTFVSIPINGVIMGDRSSTSDWMEFLSESGVVYGYEVKEQLYKLAEDDEVEGVILEINSPGGTIFGSQAIADGVEYYRKTAKKPIVAFVNNMAASGGYWAASSADYIVADAGTMMGSIGVIFGPIKYYDGVMSEDGGAFVGGVQTTGGIESEYITAGISKDLGNPYRKMTAEERAHLQKMVDGSYEQFVSFVAERRNLDVADLKNTVGALIYDEITAKEVGLIDWSGNKESAYDLLANKAGVAPEEYKILREIAPDAALQSLFARFSFVSGRQVASPLCGLESNVLALYGAGAIHCSR